MFQNQVVRWEHQYYIYDYYDKDVRKQVNMFQKLVLR